MDSDEIADERARADVMPLELAIERELASRRRVMERRGSLLHSHVSDFQFLDLTTVASDHAIDDSAAEMLDSILLERAQKRKRLREAVAKMRKDMPVGKFVHVEPPMQREEAPKQQPRSVEHPMQREESPKQQRLGVEPPIQRKTPKQQRRGVEHSLMRRKTPKQQRCRGGPSTSSIKGLPIQFCKLNLPTHDVSISLVDESGDEHQTKYLFHKTGLSGGWRGFSVAHELVEGDALVFQLIKATKFKVYIIRASGYNQK